MPFLRDRLLGTEGRDYGVLLGVGVCLFVGGADIGAPWLDGALQVGVALLAGWWFCTAPREQIGGIPKTAWLIAGLLVAFPLLQLIPLPPAIWHSIPGRGLERDALALVGQQDSWRPLSITPDHTISTTLSIMATAIFIPMSAALNRGGRSRLMALIVMVATASVLVGTQQVTGEAGNIFQFFRSDLHILTGFMRNRNSQADLLLIAMMATAACASELLRLPGMDQRQRQILLLTGGMTILLALSVVLTGSRTGILLIAAAIGAQALILSDRVRLQLGLLALPAMAAVALATLWNNPVILKALGHFRDGLASRPALWSDTSHLAIAYLPWGTGLGAFSTAYIPAERLELVNELTPAHAFNDYVQLSLEGGVPGLIVLLVVAGMVGLAAFRGFGSPVYGSRAQYRFALFTLLLLAAHSVWDYPLRVPALACVAACCIGMLLPRKTPARRRGGHA